MRDYDFELYVKSDNLIKKTLLFFIIVVLSIIMIAVLDIQEMFYNMIEKHNKEIELTHDTTFKEII